MPSEVPKAGQFAPEERQAANLRDVYLPETEQPAPGDWPPIGYEPMRWSSSIDARMLSRADRELLNGPYDAAVAAAIEDLTPRLSPDTVARATEASNEIARFDADIGHEIAPFASILLRTESASSSMIENLSSGAKAVALAELGSEDKRNAREIVGNIRAMQAALELADSLDEDAILRMHAALMEHAHPDIAGRWRSEPVWIGGDADGPIGAAYVAPRHERVPGAISDLIRFARREDLPALVQAAVAHAQFETIHPFADGNGRIGRALVHAMLRSKELTRKITVPVSAGLLADTDRYFQALTDYREGDPEPIVNRLSEASFRAIANGRSLAEEITRIRGEWDSLITQRRNGAAWRVADLVLRQPVLDGAHVAQALSIPPNSARGALDHLTEAGILTEFTGFRRNRMWQSRQILDALEAFAARAGRRVAGRISG